MCLGGHLLPARCRGAAGLQELVSGVRVGCPHPWCHRGTGCRAGTRAPRTRTEPRPPRSTCAAGLWQCAPTAQPCPPLPRCPDSEFPCRTSGRCVPGAWLCDNEDDCGDGSDEVCAPRCAPHQHRCARGQCVPWGARCDGVPDCADGSDERGCPPPACAPPEFRCASGRCIPRARVCDGELDCGFADDSDEAGEWPQHPADGSACSRAPW